MTQRRIDLDLVDADLEEVRANVDHGDAVHNPHALTALRAAEHLRDEVDRLRHAVDATIAPALHAGSPGDTRTVLADAAALLDQLADEAVVDGPWEYRDRRDDPEMFPWTVFAPKANYSAGTGFAPGTARYMAAMNPCLGRALALWLRTAAGRIHPSTGVSPGSEAAFALGIAESLLRKAPR